MTELERAADFVARCIPTGFSTPEDNQRACNLIDGLAAEILLMESDPAPDGLAALFGRQQRRIEGLGIELVITRVRADTAMSDLAFHQADALLSNKPG